MLLSILDYLGRMFKKWKYNNDPLRELLWKSFFVSFKRSLEECSNVEAFFLKQISLVITFLM